MLTIIGSNLIMRHHTSGAHSMSVSYSVAQKSRYRITLEMEVLNDFDPHQIDWGELFALDGNESASVYIEDLTCPEKW